MKSLTFCPSDVIRVMEADWVMGPWIHRDPYVWTLKCCALEPGRPVQPQAPSVGRLLTNYAL